MLPLGNGKHRKIAVIGPNAKLQISTGGGSASLRAIRSSSPLEGILEAAGKDSVEVQYTPGIFAHKFLPLVDPLISSPRRGKGYLDLDFFKEDPKTTKQDPIHTVDVDTANNFMCDNLPADLPTQCYMRATTDFTPDATGVWEFGLVVA